MKDLQYTVLRKEQFDGFISMLSILQKVIAPVSKGYNNFSFEEVTSGASVALK